MYSKLFCGYLEASNLNTVSGKQDECEIKLYKIELSKYHELVSEFTVFLSEIERNRADRYHFVKDKNRFIICRSILKFLLAEHIGLNIDKICIDSDFNKKPYLPSHPLVFFNVTHAEDYAIIALGKCELGVDIEYIDKKFDFSEILPTVFNKIEIDVINNSENKSFSFYKFWTRKEAIVKAIGKGIDDNIPKIPATDGLHSVSSILLSDFKNINVFSFDINADYIGAIALTENIDNVDNNWIEKIQIHNLPESDTLQNLINQKYL